MKKISIGISDFKDLIEGDFYFIDKSLFIKDIIEDSAQIILLPRPRRFGKTLNLSMLRYFFEFPDNFESYNNNSNNAETIRKLFCGLSIEKEPVFKKHLCSYPVIYLTFKDIKNRDFNGALKAIKLLIAEEFERHAYLLENDFLTKVRKKDFEDIISRDADMSVYERALKDITFYLNRYHQKKPVILIDEYDTPIHTSYEHGYYDEIIPFFKSFLGSGLKDNKNLFKGVLTGILRVAKESIFSDMNNLGVYSLLMSEYSERFGFTQKEADDMLIYYKIEDKKKEVKDWYDGYIFGKTKVYNPWSIVKFMASEDKELNAYWVNTSSNSMIKNLIKDSPDNVKTGLYDLIKNIPVTAPIDENIVLTDLAKDATTIYSFLLFSGYLKAFDKERIDKRDYYKLAIPNKEVARVFEDVIIKWIQESCQNAKLYEMLKVLTEGDIEVFEMILNDFVISTLSYFDTEKKAVEKVYHAFILGMLVSLAPRYEVKSNKESGYGRYDISVIPKDINKKAVIMELKVLYKETKDQALDSALRQIEEKKYETEIIDQGIKDIIKIGVVFDGKQVWVKKS